MNNSIVKFKSFPFFPMKKILVFLLALFILSIVNPGQSAAQECFPWITEPSDPMYCPPTEAPLDSSVLLLVIAGLAFGIYKVHENKNQKLILLLPGRFLNNFNHEAQKPSSKLLKQPSRKLEMT